MTSRQMWKQFFIELSVWVIIGLVAVAGYHAGLSR